MAEQALSGVKVLDLSNYIPGPYAAMLLGDQGAEVIKLERPRGDPYRKVPGFLVWNRGKRSITIDLKKREGQKLAQELARRSDIVIESFQPGVAQRLGVGFETVREVNPRLIYCAISGFGESGPYKDRPGYDPIAASLAAVYADQGLKDNPVFVILPLTSYFTALMAVQGMTAALLARDITGKGQMVEIPLLNGVLAAEAHRIVDFPGVMRLPSGSLGPAPLYRLYKTADDWVMVACGNPTFCNKLAIALGHEDWVGQPFFEGVPYGVPPEHREELARRVGEALATRPREEWLRIAREQDLPIAPAKTVEEFLDDSQVKANNMVVELNDPSVGKVRQMGIPVKLELTPGRIKGPAPLLGQHTDEVLRELGYSAASIAELRARRVV